MGKQPTKVDKIPEGYVFSHKDDVTGRDIYKKTSSTEGFKTKVKPTNTKPVVTGSPKLLRPPLPRKKLPTVQEDFVYMEPIAPTVPTPTVPTNTNIPIYEDTRIDRKLQPPINPNVDFYKYPDPNAGYSKPSNMYFDKTTQRPVDILKSIGPDGKYNPVYTDTLTANEGKYQGTIKQGNPRVTTDPTKTNVLPGNEIDKSGTKKGEVVGTIGFKKGGLVGKIKGYKLGGDINGDGVLSAEEQQKLDNQNKAKNIAGSALGSFGTSYYSSQQPENEADATRGSVLSATSQMGPIGGVISGAAGIGDKIGKPIKGRNEQLDSSGNLVNANKSKNSAIIGSLLSPSKALAYRAQTGNWTDVTGDAYNKSIEDKAKSQLNQVNVANRNAKMQQLIAARNANDFNPQTQNMYDISGATFDANHNLVLANGQQFAKGGLVQKLAKGGLTMSKAKTILHDKEVKGHPLTDKQRRFFGAIASGDSQYKSNGGVIEGPGGPKDDKITAKVEDGSFVVPADKAKVAESLRATLLRKAPKAPANLNQKGGEKVKLSNKEHLFTPEEKEELIEKGVDMNKLAPNAENKEEMIEKKSHIMFPSFANGGIVKGTKVDGATWNGKNWVSDNGSVYSAEGGKKFTDKYNQSVAKAKSNEEQRKSAEVNVYKRKLEQAKALGNDAEASRLQAKINSLTGTQPSTKEVYKTEDKTVSKPSIKAPTAKKVPQDLSTGMPSKDIATSGLKEDAANREAANLATSDANIAKQAPISTSEATTNKAPKKRSVLGGFGDNFDPTAFVGFGQTALGLNMLRGQKRPIYNPTLDPTYNAAVNRSIQDAKYGLTPEQNFLANQDIDNALRDSKYAALNTAGGSGVQAFNTTRAAINDAWRNKLGLKEANLEARMNKQKYADEMAANRADILAQNRKDVFNNAMSTFQQKQQAGSELIGAGLANAIGAYRFRQDQEARRKADEARGYSLDNYNPTM